MTFISCSASEQLGRWVDEVNHQQGWISTFIENM